MAEIVRLGNIQREKMPGELANAGYFHLFQQVLFYYPDGKHKLHEWMEKEFRLWCDVIGRSVEHGELREEIDVQETAALFRPLVPNVFLRRPRCRDSPKAFPLYIWAAEALSRLSAVFFTI